MMKDKRNYIKSQIIRKIETGGRYSVVGRSFYSHQMEGDVDFTKKVSTEYLSCMKELVKNGDLATVGGFLVLGTVEIDSF